MKFIFIFLVLLSQKVDAFMLRPELHYLLVNDYQVKSISNPIESQGLGGGFSLFFGEEKIDLLMGSDPYQWIFGMGLQFASVKTSGQSLALLNLPSEIVTDLYKIQTLLGLAYYSWRFEIPVSLIYAQEKTSPINNDQKYGWGVGVQVIYNCALDFSIGASYDYSLFEHGKNASTGQSGTLANDISISGPRIFLTYSFYWSSI